MEPSAAGSAFASVLFDLDGVLVDSRVPIARCINHALVRLALPAQPEPSLHRFIGPPLHGAFGALLRELDADPELAERCVVLYRERYATASLEETTLVPGIEGALREAAARWPLAVATSKPTAFAAPILARLGIDGLFRAVVGPGLDARGEPKAETLGRALATLGLGGDPRPASVMVGDRHHDVEAGRAHGCRTLGVTWGIGSEAELRESGADRIVHAPAELVACLERLERDGSEAR